MVQGLKRLGTPAFGDRGRRIVSNHAVDYEDEQQDLFETEYTRSLLDQLLADSRLYKRSKDYQALLEFVVQLRGFAPFNAMLLQVQKPGLSYAASERDWWVRFRRRPKEGARPLLILWPFAPVALVYDVMDTEGEPLPDDVASFDAVGSIGEDRLRSFESLLGRKSISLCWVDAGDRNAGLIRVVQRPTDEKQATQYRVHINRNHDPAVQFTTLAHELGHLYVGHLGSDSKLKIPERRGLSHAQQEIEAESVAFIVCHRNGIKPKSQTYLSSFVDSDTAIDDVDVYQVMRAAGQVETTLDLAPRSRFERP